MEIIRIQLKDTCYYDDDFEYKPFYVIKDKHFEKQYDKLLDLCNDYENFQDIEDFIEENFTKIEIEERFIEV